jgi:branched-chain amino acid transport system substrate-binding protein
MGAAACVAAATLAACSSSGSSGSAAGGGASASGGGSGQTIVIGAPESITGPDALNGANCVKGMELAAQEINAAGGIKALGGAKVKIVSVDTSSTDPAQALSATQKLIQQNHPVALVGSYATAMTQESSRAAEEAGIPILTQSLASTLTTTGNKFLFQIPPNATDLGTTLMTDLEAVAKSQGASFQSLAIVTGNDASGQEENTAVTAAAKTAGIKVSASESYPVGLSDATSIVSALQGAKPSAIVIEGVLPDITLIMKQARSSGVTAQFVSPGGGGILTPQFLSSVGSSIANGTVAISPWNWDLQLPGVAAAAAAYDKEYNVSFMPVESGESWAGVQQIVAAINAAKSADPSKIRDALASTTFSSGPASAMPPGKVSYTSTGASAAEPILLQWQNGKLQTIYPTSLATTKALSTTF